jgi:hypothetical protein
MYIPYPAAGARNAYALSLFFPCMSFVPGSWFWALPVFLVSSVFFLPQCDRGRRSAMSGVRTPLAPLEAAALPASVLRLWPFRGVECSGVHGCDLRGARSTRRWAMSCARRGFFPPRVLLLSFFVFRVSSLRAFCVLDLRTPWELSGDYLASVCLSLFLSFPFRSCGPLSWDRT